MSLQEKLENDFQAAMKNQDKGVMSTLRLVLSALKNEKINKMADLNDEDVIKILKSEIKKRKDSIVDYEKGQRQDLADKEKNEITILEKYLPAQLSEEEITVKVKQLLVKFEGEKNIGKIMGAVMAELKGAADGNLVRKIVEQTLAE